MIMRGTFRSLTVTVSLVNSADLIKADVGLGYRQAGVERAAELRDQVISHLASLQEVAHGPV